MLGEVEFIIASDDAVFFDPHVTYGMTAAFEPVQMLSKMPFQEIMRLSLLGAHERMSAERAFQVGLVSEVVPRDELLERAGWAARVIADAPPLVIQGTMRALWTALEVPRAQGIGMANLFTRIGSDAAAFKAGQDRFAFRPARGVATALRRRRYRRWCWHDALRCVVAVPPGSPGCNDAGGGDGHRPACDLTHGPPQSPRPVGVPLRPCADRRARRSVVCWRRRRLLDTERAPPSISCWMQQQIGRRRSGGVRGRRCLSVVERIGALDSVEGASLVTFRHPHASGRRGSLRRRGSRSQPWWTAGPTRTTGSSSRAGRSIRRPTTKSCSTPAMAEQLRLEVSDKIELDSFSRRRTPSALWRATSRSTCSIGERHGGRHRRRRRGYRRSLRPVHDGIERAHRLVRRRCHARPRRGARSEGAELATRHPRGRAPAPWQPSCVPPTTYGRASSTASTSRPRA